MFEKKIKALINKHKLRSIEMSFASGVNARALPAAYHPLVDERRRNGVVALGGSVSMDQLEQVTADAMKSVANGGGSDIAAALTSLEASLKRLSV